MFTGSRGPKTSKEIDMAAIGGILIVAALAVGGFCVWAGSVQTARSTEVEMFNNIVAITPVTMFVLGAVAMLLLLLGIWLAFFATKRRYRSHRERRMLEKREKEQAAELAETRAKLAKREGTTAPAGTPAGTKDAPPTAATPSAPTRPDPTSSTAGWPTTGSSSTGSSARPSAEPRQPGSSANPAPGPREDGTFDSGTDRR